MSLVATEPSSEPNLDEFQTLPIHKSAREGRSVGGGNFSAFPIWVKYMFTHLQMRNPGVQRQFSYSPRPWQPAWRCSPSCSRLLQQLFRWMIKVKPQPARVSPFLFKEEWGSCHLLMHYPASCMQTRHPFSADDTMLFCPPPPSFKMCPQRPALGDWSGGAVASVETWRECAHPASQTKTLQHVDLMWSVR